jgi:hypothetical protein
VRGGSATISAGPDFGAGGAVAGAALATRFAVSVPMLFSFTLKPFS